MNVIVELISCNIPVNVTTIIENEFFDRINIQKYRLKNVIYFEINS